MTTPTLHKVAESRVQECLQIASKKTKISFKFEGVKFFNKSQAAGYVIPSRGNVVHLNMDLLKKNQDTFINKIIPHEVAHLVASTINPSDTSHHGPTWKRVMQGVFNLEPIRCHDMDTTGIGRNVKRFVYICSCQKHTIGSTRHNKITTGAKYHCGACKKELVFLKSL